MGKKTHLIYIYYSKFNSYLKRNEEAKQLFQKTWSITWMNKQPVTRYLPSHVYSSLSFFFVVSQSVKLDYHFIPTLNQNIIYKTSNIPSFIYCFSPLFALNIHLLDSFLIVYSIVILSIHISHAFIFITVKYLI